MNEMNESRTVSGKSRRKGDALAQRLSSWTQPSATGRPPADAHNTIVPTRLPTIELLTHLQLASRKQLQKKKDNHVINMSDRVGRTDGQTDRQLMHNKEKDSFINAAVTFYR